MKRGTVAIPRKEST